jgi:hypothetical protein
LIDIKRIHSTEDIPVQTEVPSRYLLPTYLPTYLLSSTPFSKKNYPWALCGQRAGYVPGPARYALGLFAGARPCPRSLSWEVEEEGRGRERAERLAGRREANDASAVGGNDSCFAIASALLVVMSLALCGNEDASRGTQASGNSWYYFLHGVDEVIVRLIVGEEFWFYYWWRVCSCCGRKLVST